MQRRHSCKAGPPLGDESAGEMPARDDPAGAEPAFAESTRDEPPDGDSTAAITRRQIKVPQSRAILTIAFLSHSNAVFGASVAIRYPRAPATW